MRALKALFVHKMRFIGISNVLSKYENLDFQFVLPCIVDSQVRKLN